MTTPRSQFHSLMQDVFRDRKPVSRALLSSRCLIGHQSSPVVRWEVLPEEQDGGDHVETHQLRENEYQRRRVAAAGDRREHLR